MGGAPAPSRRTWRLPKYGHEPVAWARLREAPNMRDVNSVSFFLHKQTVKMQLNVRSTASGARSST